MNHSYPEPFGEAMSYSSQRAAQLTSLFIALTQAFLQYRARHERQQAERDHAVAAELARAGHAARRQAQATWAAAHDPAWLGRADLFQTADVWGAAMPDAPADPSAAVAMSKCESRLTRPAPVRHGPLRPAARPRSDPVRGDAPGGPAVWQPPRPPAGPACTGPPSPRRRARHPAGRPVTGTGTTGTGRQPGADTLRGDESAKYTEIADLLMDSAVGVST